VSVGTVRGAASGVGTGGRPRDSSPVALPLNVFKGERSIRRKTNRMGPKEDLARDDASNHKYLRSSIRVRGRSEREAGEKAGGKSG
jgi:hypothetical protein